MKKIKILLVTIITICLTSCSKSDDLENDFNLRFVNSSNKEFEHITIEFDNIAVVRYELLNNDTETFHYSFASFPEEININLDIENQRFSLNGENDENNTNYRTGNYTIEIDIQDYENRTLSYSIRKDDNPILPYY